MPSDTEFIEEVVMGELEAVTKVIAELDEKLAELLEPKARAQVFRGVYENQLNQCASQGELKLVEQTSN